MTKTPLIMPDAPFLKEHNEDGQLFSPSAERNLGPIIKQLANHVPAQGTALEIASGTGQHVATLAKRFPRVNWQPSDIALDRLRSIEAWRKAVNLENLLPALQLNAAGKWDDHLTDLKLIYVVNLFHLISQKDAAAVLKGMSDSLGNDGRVFIYGPFKEDGRYRSDGDAQFDSNLTAHDPEIGYKDVAWMWQQMKESGLDRVEQIEMPANNLSLVSQKYLKSRFDTC